MRARDLGIVIGKHQPGPHNAITDVPGVKVGHVTLNEGSGPTSNGRGPIRTGVTSIIPHDEIWDEPVFAAPHSLNGSGELTGLEWVRESGLLTTPVVLTNTHSVGVARDAVVEAQVRKRGTRELYWSLPVVGETYDGVLNDINGYHVRPDHVQKALECARSGPVAEGNVGGGTGMICHEFKGGIGTSSRVAAAGSHAYTVGVLVQANYGRRERLRINGIGVGEKIGNDAIPVPKPREMYTPGSGSIIIVVATDAPLLPHQCRRMAQRAGLALARMGGTGEQESGDIFLAFSTGNRGLPAYKYSSYAETGPSEASLRMLVNDHMTPLFDLVIDATEEAIVNALVAAETMAGRNGVVAHALDHDLLQQALA